MVKQSPEDLRFVVDENVYPLEVVQAAAYTMTDHIYVRMTRQGEKITVQLKQKPGSTMDSNLISDEFYNELLHEALRREVSRANQKIREYIVTKALVSAQTPSVMPDPAPGTVLAGGSGRSRQPMVDAALEKEIDKLLKEIETAGPREDPLGIAIPWEKCHSHKGGFPAKTAKIKNVRNRNCRKQKSP